MLTKILKLKDVQELHKFQQKKVKGGIIPPFPQEGCGCVVRNRFGILEIVAVSCNSTCPDGTAPVPGLGY